MPSLNLCLRSNWFVCWLEDRGHRIQAYVELAIRCAEPVRERPHWRLRTRRHWPITGRGKDREREWIGLRLVSLGYWNYLGRVMFMSGVPRP